MLSRSLSAQLLSTLLCSFSLSALILLSLLSFLLSLSSLSFSLFFSSQLSASEERLFLGLNFIAALERFPAALPAGGPREAAPEAATLSGESGERGDAEFFLWPGAEESRLGFGFASEATPGLFAGGLLFEVDIRERLKTLT